MNKIGNPDNAASNQPTVEELQAQLAEAKKQVETAEKRRKDTVAEFTRRSQENKALQAEIEMLKEKAQFGVEMTPELEQLMYDNPQEWRLKVNEIERQQKADFEKALEEKKAALSKQDVAAQRAQILAEFNERHPECQITDEVIAKDIPPRILEGLDKNKSFEDVLVDIYTYLTGRKVIGDGQQTLNQPDLSTMAGGSTPSDAATAKDIKSSYYDEIY